MPAIRAERIFQSAITTLIGHMKESSKMYLYDKISQMSIYKHLQLTVFQREIWRRINGKGFLKIKVERL